MGIRLGLDLDTTLPLKCGLQGPCLGLAARKPQGCDCRLGGAICTGRMRGSEGGRIRGTIQEPTI